MNWKYGTRLSDELRECSSLSRAVAALEEGQRVEDNIVILNKQPDWRDSWLPLKTEWVESLKGLVRNWKDECEKFLGVELSIVRNDEPVFISWLAQEYLKNKPSWVRMGNTRYYTGNYLWVDDGCTMGVPHPEIPQFIFGILEEMPILYFVQGVWSGKFKELSEEPGVKKVGLSPENSCPACGGFLIHRWTIDMGLHYHCSFCGYEHRIESK